MTVRAPQLLLKLSSKMQLILLRFAYSCEVCRFQLDEGSQILKIDFLCYPILSPSPHALKFPDMMAGLN